MQDRYAGDVGDFGKFGLLRHLCGKTATDSHPHLKPGVIWYRVADETHNADGECVEYLEKSAPNDQHFRACDETLYDALAKMVLQDNDRSIAALERAALLPEAAYWRDDVRYGKNQITCPRNDWFNSALEKAAGCGLVFVDPDNGMECANLLPTQHQSRKYVFLSEVRSLVECKPRPSLVIYHHMDKTKGTAEEKTERRLKCLSKALGLSLTEQPFGVLFRRCTVRSFLVLPASEHRLTLLNRTEELVAKWNDAWGKRKPEHFTGPIMV